MTEHDEQVALFELLSTYEGKYPYLKYIFAIPNGGHRHIRVAIKLKQEGVLAGVWDIFIPFAVNEYAGAFLEMKYGDNDLTEKQIEFREKVGNTYEWCVCYSALEAAHFIGDYLGISELKNVSE